MAALIKGFCTVFNTKAGTCGETVHHKIMSSSTCKHVDGEETQQRTNVIEDNGEINSQDFNFSEKPTMEDIRKLQGQFSDERNWNQFHTPRNLLLAMVGEVGEVAELFQWKGEVREGLPDWSEKEKNNLGQELSDVLIYLIRLAEKCRIDLPLAALRKIELNKLKYPVDQVYGSSKKYNEYKNK